MVRKRLRTFICFGNLPKELRDYIWDLAIQNKQDEPEIHFFGVNRGIEEFQVDIGLEVDTNITYWRRRMLPFIAPSWKSDRGVEDWASRRNPSGYLLDSGLWYACAESRDRVGRGRKSDQYRCVVAVKLPAKRGSWQRHVVTRTYEDMLVFQLRMSEIISLPMGILGYMTDTGASSIWGYQPFCGLEYDPQWAVGFEEEGEEECSKVDLSNFETDPFSRFLWEITDVSTTEGAVRALWLVDHHTLRPASGMTTAELAEDRMTFKARGWRYFEAFLHDLDDRWELDERFARWQSPWHFAWSVRRHPDYVRQLRLANVDRDSASKFRGLVFRVLVRIEEK